MNHIRRLPAATTAPAALLLLLTACSNGPNPRSDSPSREAEVAPPAALEHAWRFAEAITMDDKDRGLSKARVAGAMLAAGRVERARAMAETIENWRRGALLADIVHYQALHGVDRFDNTELLRAAETAAAEADGWRLTRVNEHIGKAKAVLGRPAEVSAVGARFAADPAARGKLGAFEALALARQGRTKEALGALEALGEDPRFDVHIWNSQGLVLLAREGGLPEEARLEVLDRAWMEAGEVPGFRKHQLRMEVIEQWGAEKERDRARPAMDEVDQAVRALAQPAHIKAPLMAEVAVVWARQGESERVKELDAEVMALVESEGIYEIERPAVLADLAEAHALAGHQERALELVRRAADLAATLVNPRPRALAAVDVALSVHRGGLDPTLVEESLNKLHATFDETAE